MNTIWLEASAGTGKTTFLISQIYDNKPEEIMFITFSNAAANELKARTKHIHRPNESSSKDFEEKKDETSENEVHITTLHALAFKIILTKLEWQAQVPKEIATSSLRNQAILQMLKNKEFAKLITWLLKQKITIDEEASTIEKPLKIATMNPPIKMNMEYESILANNQILDTEILQKIKLIFFTKSGDLRKKMPPNLPEKYTQWAIERILQHEQYKQNYAAWVLGSINFLIKQQEQLLKDSNNLLYYDDLITIATHELEKEENADLLYKYFGNIKLLLIDEAQDLSTAQWDLLITILNEWNALNGRLIIASDKKQLIYDFQGATIEGFEKNKARIKKLSKNFEIKQLNHTYRLPKKICTFLNKIGPSLQIEYVEHSTQRQLDGNIEIMLIDNISEIAEHIKKYQLSNVMVLFKYRTERIQDLAHAFFTNGLLINSPLTMQHPIIKDFQYLIDFIYNKSKFAMQILKNTGHDESSILQIKQNNICDISALCARWTIHPITQKFLSKKLQSAKSFWEHTLLEYAKFYQYDPIGAISDEQNFYKEYSQELTQGIFLNTIHSSKGMEANYVFLCDTDFSSHIFCETNRLLYVGLTRAKEKLILPIFKSNLDKLEGTWANLLIETE